jgi:hypothetical protein
MWLTLFGSGHIAFAFSDCVLLCQLCNTIKFPQHHPPSWRRDSQDGVGLLHLSQVLWQANLHKVGMHVLQESAMVQLGSTTLAYMSRPAL